MSSHWAAATSCSAAFFAAASATSFHSLGIRQNSIETPLSRHRSASPSSVSQRSLFFTSSLPFLTQVLAHSVDPFVTYSESVACYEMD
ncbi:hypothetical protein GGR55DRAFT_619253 [Xylaria sp. FL0064]|nr:hypothetical protein GGR55DRAFT_619253 [Xylaria sp. FL0064]